MPFTKDRFKSMQISAELHATLRELASETAKKEGLSKIPLPQLIERMVKVYKEKI